MTFPSSPTKEGTNSASNGPAEPQHKSHVTSSVVSPASGGKPTFLQGGRRGVERNRSVGSSIGSSSESPSHPTSSLTPQDQTLDRDRNTSNEEGLGSSLRVPGDITGSQDERREEKGDENDKDVDSDSELTPSHDTLLWKARMFCGKIVNNETVQITIISLIIVNALLMGLATFEFVREDEDVDDIFSKIDRAFLVMFTLEVTMQLFYLGFTLFADGWLVFDFLIVVLSWSFESLQVVRAFRIFRAFRLITRVKPLRDLVLAIGAVLPRMYAIAALLLLIFYIFSVLFTELFSDMPLSDDYFTTLDASLFTCMEMMTLEWGDIAREVMIEKPWAWAPFLAFILITGFIVFNLIVAVVCDAVAVTEKTVRELEGFESDSPAHKLAEAQERIDLIQFHINDMLRTQETVQNMIELMAGELLHLETERIKAEHREAELRIKMNQRVAYEQEMQKPRQVHALGRSYFLEKERRESERKLRDLRKRAEDGADALLSQSMHTPVRGERKKLARRGSGTSSGSGNGSGRNLSVKGSSQGSGGSKKFGWIESPAMSRRVFAATKDMSIKSFESDSS